MSPLLVRKSIHFSTLTFIFSENFCKILSSIVETILTFHVIKNLNIYVVVVASWLIEYCDTGWKLQFSSTYFNIFKSQKLLGEYC